MEWPQYTMIAWLVLRSIGDAMRANGYAFKEPGPALYGAKVVYFPVGFAAILWAGGFWS